MLKKINKLIIFLLIFSFLPSFFILKTEAATFDGWYEISTKYNNMTLDVSDGMFSATQNVQIYEKNKTNAQKFKIQSVGNNQYAIFTGTGDGSKALDVANYSKNGNVIQYFYHGGENQRWYIEQNNDGSVSFKNVCTGQMLDILEGGSPSKHVNQNNVRVWDKNTSYAQKFYLTKTTAPDSTKYSTANIKNGWYTIHNMHNTKQVIDVSNANNKNGTNIQLYQNNNSDAQKFYFQNVGNNEYIIKTALDNYQTIDVANGKKDSNVALWKIYTNNCQKFKIINLGGNTYGFMNESTGQFLTTTGFNNNSNIIDKAFYNNQTQGFILKSITPEQTEVSLNNGWYEISPAFATKFNLDVVDDASNDEQNIQLYQNNGNNAQKYYFKNEGDGYYRIGTASSGNNRVISVDFNGKDNVYQKNYYNKDNQRWKIYKNKNGTYTLRSGENRNNVLDVYYGRYNNGTNIRVCPFNNGGAQQFTIKSTSIPTLNPHTKVTYKCLLKTYSPNLSSKEKEIFNWIYNAVTTQFNTNGYIYCPIQAKSNEYYNAADAFKEKYYDKEGSLYYTSGIRSQVAFFGINPKMSKEGFDKNIEANRIINTYIPQIAKEIIKPGMPEKDAVMAIKKWVRDNITYASGQYLLTKLLTTKTSNCSGIAHFTEYLCKYVGIKCWDVSGRAYGEGHAWNKVYIDDDYYWIDNTWNSANLNRYGLTKTLWSDHIYNYESSNY